MSFGCKVDVNLNVPDFSDANIPLSQIAKKIATNARRNIRNQTNLDGSAYARLSVKTLKDKRREKAPYPRRALYRKGIMYRAIHVYKNAKNDFSVGIIPRGVPRRDIVAQIHQNLAPVIRTFLGFGASTYRWMNQRMQRWIIEKQQKAIKKHYTYKY